MQDPGKEGQGKPQGHSTPTIDPSTRPEPTGWMEERQLPQQQECGTVAYRREYVLCRTENWFELRGKSNNGGEGNGGVVETLFSVRWVGRVSECRVSTLASRLLHFRSVSK